MSYNFFPKTNTLLAVFSHAVTNLKQNEAQSSRAESKNKGVN